MSALPFRSFDRNHTFDSTLLLCSYRITGDRPLVTLGRLHHPFQGGGGAENSCFMARKPGGILLGLSGDENTVYPRHTEYTFFRERFGGKMLCVLPSCSVKTILRVGIGSPPCAKSAKSILFSECVFFAKPYYVYSLIPELE